MNKINLDESIIIHIIIIIKKTNEHNDVDIRNIPNLNNNNLKIITYKKLNDSIIILMIIQSKAIE